MRRKRLYKRDHKSDARYDNIALNRFINCLMRGGKKSVAERVVYRALDIVQRETKAEPISVFEKAIENASPLVEVSSKRVGGASYQIPREVRPERKFMLASRWIIAASRGKKGKGMSEKLAEELMAAYKNEGSAIKKKQDIHRMAEANRAFAHFAR